MTNVKDLERSIKRPGENRHVRRNARAFLDYEKQDYNDANESRQNKQTLEQREKIAIELLSQISRFILKVVTNLELRIAIDGGVGTGKGTQGKIFKDLDFTVINTGNLYRALTWLAFQFDVLDEAWISKQVKYKSEVEKELKQVKTERNSEKETDLNILIKWIEQYIERYVNQVFEMEKLAAATLLLSSENGDEMVQITHPDLNKGKPVNVDTKSTLRTSTITAVISILSGKDEVTQLVDAEISKIFKLFKRIFVEGRNTREITVMGVTKVFFHISPRVRSLREIQRFTDQQHRNPSANELQEITAAAHKRDEADRNRTVGKLLRYDQVKGEKDYTVAVLGDNLTPHELTVIILYYSLIDSPFNAFNEVVTLLQQIDRTYIIPHKTEIKSLNRSRAGEQW